MWPANEDFGQSFQYIANFMPTKYTLSNLEAGVVYSARIAAYSQGGDGKKSPTIYFAIGKIYFLKKWKSTLARMGAIFPVIGEITPIVNILKNVKF